MSSQFLRTSWSTYLGELRPIWDIKVKGAEPGCLFSGSAEYQDYAPTPTATETPTVTPTMTVTPTNTQTPSVTQTQTPSQTQTLSQTQTRTPDVTSTVTPTNTQTRTPTPTIFYYAREVRSVDCNCNIITPGFLIKTTTNLQLGSYYCSNFGKVFVANSGPVDPLYPILTVSGSNSTNCDLIDCGNCPTPTPTITQTSSPTNTPSLTPTNTITPTNTVTRTPSQTPTNTITSTPSVTPSQTQTRTPAVTSTVTPTNTQTGSPTPSITPSPTLCANPEAFVLYDAATGETALNDWFVSQSSPGVFRGMNVGFGFSTNQDIFQTQMNNYISYSGFGVTTFSLYGVPTTSNQDPINISGDTQSWTGTDVWVSILVPTCPTCVGGVYGSMNVGGSTFNPQSSLYNLPFNYTGSSIPQGEYRLYTSYTSSSARVSNSSSNYSVSSLNCPTSTPTPTPSITPTLTPTKS